MATYLDSSVPHFFSPALYKASASCFAAVRSNVGFSSRFAWICDTKRRLKWPEVSPLTSFSISLPYTVTRTWESWVRELNVRARTSTTHFAYRPQLWLWFGHWFECTIFQSGHLHLFQAPTGRSKTSTWTLTIQNPMSQEIPIYITLMARLISEASYSSGGMQRAFRHSLKSPLVSPASSSLKSWI